MSDSLELPPNGPVTTTHGRHLLGEYWGCDESVLDDAAALEMWMREASVAAGCTVLGALHHRFQPQGASVVLLLSESHGSIHTWPTQGYAAVDFYTCGDGDPQRAHDVLMHRLGAKTHTLTFVARGQPVTTLVD